MRWRAVVVGNVFSSSFTKLCVWNGGFSYVGTVVDESEGARPEAYGVISPVFGAASNVLGEAWANVVSGCVSTTREGEDEDEEGVGCDE
jgi:hypothetical protein